MKPLTVKEVSTAEVRAMAARGGGTLMTLGTTATSMDVICYLVVGLPYGGGAPDADVAVDAVVYYTD